MFTLSYHLGVVAPHYGLSGGMGDLMALIIPLRLDLDPDLDADVRAPFDMKPDYVTI